MITSTHRGHGHCLAKGLDPLGMFAELMAKDAGTNRGRGGSMHIADPTIGIFGANGIVAAGLPIAAGAATAAQLRGDGRVAVAFFGDGAVAHGTFHEAINLAAVWQLPVIFFCENNGYAEFSPASTQHAAPLERARRRLRRRLRRGRRQRRRGDRDRDASRRSRRRAPDAVPSSSRRRPTGGTVTTKATRSATDRPTKCEEWEARDPLLVHARRLRSAGVTDDTLDGDAVVGRARARRRRRGGAAAAGAGGRDADRLRHPRRDPNRAEPPAPAADAPVFRTMDAIRAALEAELAADERVFVAGIDVAAGGNVFGLTRGLHDRFGDRVRDTPISESAIVGLGVGAAMAGMRPVVELMYLDFLGVCLDQLLNQAAKLPFMTGGAARDGADRADPVRRGPLVGEPALAEPRGAARAHPRADRRHAVDPGRHVRVAPRRDPGPEPGRLHREPVALRHEGTAAAGRPHRPDRQVGRRAPRDRHHRRVGVAHGARGARRGRASSRAKASPSR